MPAERFQHDDLARIGDDEAVVVPAPAEVPATAALAVLFQRGDHRGNRLGGGRAPLQAEPHQIHADQSLAPLRRQPGVHGLVADRHAMLVHAHFGAPDPERARQQRGVGLGRLRDGDVGGPVHRAASIAAARLHIEELGLVALAVAVLGEQGAPGRRRFPARRHGVAHRPVLYGNGRNGASAPGTCTRSTFSTMDTSE